MAVSLEPLNRFWWFNFCYKALDVYFHSDLTGGPSDPYNRRNTAAAGSCGQHCFLVENMTLVRLNLTSNASLLWAVNTFLLVMGDDGVLSLMLGENAISCEI